MADVVVTVERPKVVITSDPRVRTFATEDNGTVVVDPTKAFNVSDTSSVSWSVTDNSGTAKLEATAVESMDELTNVDDSGKSSGSILKYDGSNYVDQNAVFDHLKDVSVSSPNDGDAAIYNATSGQWEAGPAGASEFDDLNDVDVPSPSDGDAAIYNSSSGNWESGQAGGSPEGIVYNAPEQIWTEVSTIQVGGFRRFEGGPKLLGYNQNNVNWGIWDVSLKYPIETISSVGVSNRALSSTFLEISGDTIGFFSNTNGRVVKVNFSQRNEAAIYDEPNANEILGIDAGFDKNGNPTVVVHSTSQVIYGIDATNMTQKWSVNNPDFWPYRNLVVREDLTPESAVIADDVNPDVYRYDLADGSEVYRTQPLTDRARGKKMASTTLSNGTPAVATLDRSDECFVIDATDGTLITSFGVGDVDDEFDLDFGVYKGTDVVYTGDSPSTPEAFDAQNGSTVANLSSGSLGTLDFTISGDFGGQKRTIYIDESGNIAVYSDRGTRPTYEFSAGTNRFQRVAVGGAGQSQFILLDDGSASNTQRMLARLAIPQFSQMHGIQDA